MQAFLDTLSNAKRRSVIWGERAGFPLGYCWVASPFLASRKCGRKVCSAQLKFLYSVVIATVLSFHTQVVSACEQTAGRLESYEGSASVKLENNDTWQPVIAGHSFCFGDTFRVESLRAVVRLRNDTLVKINEGGVLKFIPPDDGFWVELLDGVARFISRTPKQFTVKAPYLNAGVEGTEFIVEHRAERDTLSVVEGVVIAENTYGRTRLESLQQSTAEPGRAPSEAQVVSLPGVADWSVYYPPLLIPKSVESKAAQAYFQGHFAESYRLALAENNASLTAALALFYGQTAVFDAALPAVDLFTQRTLLVYQTVFSGYPQKGLSQAEALNAEYPENAVALLALSYAQQASGQVAQALASAQLAASYDQNALVHLRLAELALIAGDQALASDYLTQLESSSFDSAYGDTLTALIALQNNRNRKAQALLQTSVTANKKLPLTQFTLGLVNIRLGELEAGRKKLELAVALDPSNSIYRSYLGKAYAEEYRADEAQEQLSLAKILDPDDPTPWFYQGLNQQSSGDYAGAIESYEKSLALNDSRHVYRSSNALQNDAAVKSANIGTSYRGRGLKKKAELLGSQIIAEDPNSYAGHSLMVEAYADDNRRESLLASSRLKATIAQPLGAKALPIGLLEPGLQTVIGASPTDIGISEYTQLFIDEGIGGHATVLGGSDDLRAYDVMLQGTREQVSVSLGQYRYDTEGYRENNDASYLLSSAMVHWQPKSNLSFQVEYGEFDDEHGDLSTSLDADDYLPNFREGRDSDIARLAVRYDFNKTHGFLANYTLRNRDFSYSYSSVFDFGDGGVEHYFSNETATRSQQFDGQY
ncbi:MAG TPA: FecR domain-containing protein, partial [Marinagarivorans sp.]